MSVRVWVVGVVAWLAWAGSARSILPCAWKTGDAASCLLDLVSILYGVDVAHCTRMGLHRERARAEMHERKLEGGCRGYRDSGVGVYDIKLVTTV